MIYQSIFDFFETPRKLVHCFVRRVVEDSFSWELRKAKKQIESSLSAKFGREKKRHKKMERKRSTRKSGGEVK